MEKSLFSAVVEHMIEFNFKIYNSAWQWDALERISSSRTLPLPWCPCRRGTIDPWILSEDPLPICSFCPDRFPSVRSCRETLLKSPFPQPRWACTPIPLITSPAGFPLCLLPPSSPPTVMLAAVIAQMHLAAQHHRIIYHSIIQTWMS